MKRTAILGGNTRRLVMRFEDNPHDVVAYPGDRVEIPVPLGTVVLSYELDGSLMVAFRRVSLSALLGGIAGKP